MTIKDAVASLPWPATPDASIVEPHPKGGAPQRAWMTPALCEAEGSPSSKQVTNLAHEDVRQARRRGTRTFLPLVLVFFEFDAEAIGQSIDVSEVGGHLNDVV